MNFSNTNFINEKWSQIQNKNTMDSVKNMMKMFYEHNKEGGFVWFKYTLGNIDKISNDVYDKIAPKWMCFKKDSDMWNTFVVTNNSHLLLTQDYDPEKHLIIFLSIHYSTDTLISNQYGQLVRIDI